MVHIQIYGHIPFFFILGRGLFQCPLLTAPLSYLPNAQDINFILQDIVVESNANISHSGSQTSGMFSFA